MTTYSPEFRRIEARLRGFTIDPPRANPDAQPIESKISRIWRRLTRDGHNPWDVTNIVPGRPLATMGTPEKVRLVARLRVYMHDLGYTVEEIHYYD